MALSLMHTYSHKKGGTMNKRTLLAIVILLLAALACSAPGATPNPSDPNAFNTMIALTDQARPAAPPAVTAPPTLPPTATLPPTITPTQGPSELVRATVSLPRHAALDLETQAISAPLSAIADHTPDLSQYWKKAPAGADFVFYGAYPDVPEAQFLFPVNGALMASLYPGLRQASYAGCVQAFGGDGYLFGPNQQNEAFPLDISIFKTEAGKYICFTTDRGNLGAFKLSAPGDYIGMRYVIIEYVIWDKKLP